MRKRLSGLDFPVECQKDGPHRIAGAGIGYDHIRNGLRFRCDFVPAFELGEHS